MIFSLRVRQRADKLVLEESYSGQMEQLNNQRLLELCEAASKETNPDRLVVLVREINELLDQAKVPAGNREPAA